MNVTFGVERILEDVRARLISRRQALKALAATSMAAAMAPFLIGNALAAGQLMGPGGIPLATAEHAGEPAALRRADQERARSRKTDTFNLFNYHNYIDKGLVDEFGKKYNVKCQVTVFDSMDQAITKLSTHAVEST